MQDKKGKGKPVDWDTEVAQEERALEVLIGMTAKTLCRRSNSHLEQALLLIEVSLGHATLHWGMLVNARKDAEALRAAQQAVREEQAKQAAEAGSKADAEQEPQPSTAAAAALSLEPAQPAASTPQAAASAEQRTGDGDAATPSTTAGAGASTAGAATPARDTSSTAAAADAGGSGQQAAAQVVLPELNQQDNPGPIIQSLPEHLLKQLARLLGQSGLSELAQKRCANVVRMLVDTCPQLKPLMLSELQNELQR